MKPKPRTPARQALADAIARHREAEADFARKTTARARTAASVTEAELKLQDCRRSLNIARQEHVDRVEAAHDAGRNVATAPALGVREARDALHAAEDNLEIVRGVLARMDAKLAGPQAEPVELSPEEERASKAIPPRPPRRSYPSVYGFGGEIGNKVSRLARPDA